METIAVLGTGRMGTPICRRLLSAGHQVAVWNRTASRSERLVRAGARRADSPAAAVADADTVITVLSDAVAVDTVLFGPAGAASALRPGTCLVQMSTIGPEAVAELARRLPAEVHLIDAPVVGSVDAAQAGRLTVLAAGDPAAVDRAAPVLQALGTVRRCGALGAGSALKLVLNTALVTAMAALRDTVAVADAVGVDRSVALAALGTGPLGGAAKRATATGAWFPIALASKDITLALRHLGDRPAPVARAAARVLSAAPDQNADLSVLV